LKIEIRTLDIVSAYLLNLLGSKLNARNKKSEVQIVKDATNSMQEIEIVK